MRNNPIFQYVPIGDSGTLTNGSGKELGTGIDFQYAVNSQDIHVEMRDGEPWFVAADVCEILALSNPTEALRSLDDDEKLTSEILRSGQVRKLNLISESGLYALIIRSNKPTAKKFRKWITSVVLPSIRKTGSYGVQGDLFAQAQPSSITEAYKLVRKQQHDGHTWCSATDLLTLSGRQRSGGTTKKYGKMKAEGKACKLYDTNGEKWYIREDAINEFNGVKPHHLLKAAMAQLLSKGGSHV